MRNRDETINDFIEEINQNELISKKAQKNEWKSLNYIDHLLISASAVTWCVSISALASLVCIPIRIVSSSGGLKFFCNNLHELKIIISNKIVSLAKA